MAPRERSASKILLAFSLSIAACSVKTGHEDLPWINASAINVQWENGKACYNHRPINGILYTLNRNNRDTLMISSYRSGLEDGLWKLFYPDGHIAEVRSFSMGRKTGLYTAWWSNGQRKLEYHFENGEYEGCCREWGPGGRLAREMHYHLGYEDGSQKLFYEDGRIKSNYVMIRGRRYGLLGTKNCVNVGDSIFKK